MLHSRQDRCCPKPKYARIIKGAISQAFSELVQSADSLTVTFFFPTTALYIHRLKDSILKFLFCELVNMADLNPHNYVLRFFSFRKFLTPTGFFPRGFRKLTLKKKKKTRKREFSTHRPVYQLSVNQDLKYDGNQ